MASPQCELRLSQLTPGWSANHVEVPVDYKKPNGKKLPVYYYHRKWIPGKTPIIFFNGGPVVSSGRATGLYDAIPELKDENLIILDQRGVGCSGSLPDYIPGNGYREYLNFTSRSIVRDAEEIRKKVVGAKKWKIYGQSFGGLISFRYIELFPQSLESVHIHGYGVTPKHQSFTELREQRLQDISDAFLNFRPSSEHPSIGEIISAINQFPDAHVRDAFNESCIPTPGARRSALCGQDIYSGLYLLAGFKNFWPLIQSKLEHILSQMKSGDLDKLRTAIQSFANTYVLRFNQPNLANALGTITYMEIIPGNFFYEQCDAVVANEVLSECRFSSQFLIRLQEDVKSKPIPLNLKKIRSNIKKHTLDVRYYAGAWDSFVPYEIIQHTAKALGLEKSLVLFPDSGHEGFSTEVKLLRGLVGLDK